MLVVTVKDGERVWLKDGSGQDVWVMLVSASTGRAKIGVEAPASVKIVREALLRKEPENI